VGKKLNKNQIFSSINKKIKGNNGKYSLISKIQ
jgi:hypothetical protein